MPDVLDTAEVIDPCVVDNSVVLTMVVFRCMGENALSISFAGHIERTEGGYRLGPWRARITL